MTARAANAPPGQPDGDMTISYGWSLDLTGTGAEFGALMVAGLLGSALILPASTLGATYDPGSDPYSMAAIADATGANDWWNAGYTGQGVDVAVIERASAGPGWRRAARSSTAPTSRSSRRRQTCETSTPTATERSWPD